MQPGSKRFFRNVCIITEKITKILIEKYNLLHSLKTSQIMFDFILFSHCLFNKNKNK